MFSAPAVSVSMSVVLRGTKKLRVNTDIEGSLANANVGTGLVDRLAVCEVLPLVSLHPGSHSPRPLIL